MPTINGRAYDHSSSTIRIAGVPFTEIKSIEYSHGTEGHATLHGTSKKPQSVTSGIYKADEGSLEMSNTEWQQLRRLLGPGYLERRFPITVARAEGGNFETDSLVSVKITKVGKGSSEGGEVAMTKLSLHIMEVVEDGVPAVIGPVSTVVS